ncbi:hypothetical protein DTO013E5_5231 [Penicillium roqueforti]|uniref:Genomic scaffold, ProqFM164S01 n=1 Tax=Penicillium roqueforti (strain FM164) TaxID=1365484 RepID=W6PZG4_PENRF|nr:uncharacterized protein LCP9604111_5519 [Penicillium roqueforti]CDM29430.1 unnamed protein product [Penicillium roqueforti FM164]KAF9248264.1 hypothetical protein LCP9604111_5519 [Penicillium roqueforti]KAI1836122.1 hypothetical protein CBS147337_3271 [Penicillium roqueforti]KAI2680084.1 hypothetical protein LCP963914a_7174 [Penicillium roqueforti]KAI2683145.1 hypothetical protein CBS147355_2285 [Penicillium roqueforti]
MERKLSAKASQIRHRLTFTRSNSARALEPTLVSPIEVSPPSSRPRSATNPESPTHAEPTWHRDPGPSGGYSFTDEPGYFRPASPFIDRQEIEEDLEDDIKHACAMLSHSIDRGMPAGLSYRSAVTVGQNPQPSVDAAPSSLKQHVVLLSAINLQADSTKRHDSGVGMINSPSQKRRPSGNSVSGTNISARFYNKQPSASPPHSPSPGTRSRGQSLEVTIEDKERGRACSPSLIPFYSPLQMNSEWTWTSKPTTLHSPVSSLNDTDKRFEVTESELKTHPHEIATDTNAIPETFSPAISPHEAPLGWTGRTWLHVSGDIPCLIDENAPTEAKQAKPMARFYSSCNRTTGSLRSREWPPKDYWEEQDLNVHGKVTPDSLLGSGRETLSRPETGISRLGSASTNEEDSPGGYLYPPFADPNRGMSYSSSCLADDMYQERIYSVAMPGSPKNNRRNKASLLLRKLAGLGRKKDNDNGNEFIDGSRS